MGEIVGEGGSKSEMKEEDLMAIKYLKRVAKTIDKIDEKKKGAWSQSPWLKKEQGALRTLPVEGS